MESIFKALSKEYNSVKDNPDVAVAEKRELLEEIVKYVNSMTWLSRKATKEKISFYIKSGYDYDALCKEFDITYEAAKNAVKWASKQLKSKIGRNTVQLIRFGYIEEARVAFYVGIGKISRDNLFISDLNGILPESKYSAIYDLQDCVAELALLRKMSRAYLKKYADKVDSKKMSYLLSLIEGDSRKAMWLRPYIINAIQGYTTLEDLLGMEEKIKKEKYLY